MSNDWLMRQIEDATRLIASVVFNKKFEPYLILEEDGRVNSENLLFETLEEAPREEYLPVALAFYEGLAQMDDTRLHSCRYTRAEILEGLAALRVLYGIEPVAGQDE